MNVPGTLIAPGWPGIPPRWTSSAKSGVGTALSATSRVWFTLSHGILNEIYFPRLDQASTRDFGLIVTDGNEFFSEEKRHTTSRINHIVEGAPAFHLTNTCGQGRYRIEKDVLADPLGDAVVQRVRFVPLTGSLKDYHLYALLAPHLGNFGAGNTAWTAELNGWSMLVAERNGNALALGCSSPWLRRSVGFVGCSDGWQDLVQHNQLTWSYGRAENGNVALVGEIDLSTSGGEFLLAVGFGRTASEAGYHARASLEREFELTLSRYCGQWSAWQKGLYNLDEPKTVAQGTWNEYRVSTAVLRTHESKTFPGGIIASLSIPWGFAKGDDDLGGYHLVWPRDLTEVAGALLAAGATEDVLRVLYYLQSTQLADGHWPQNLWLDGTPYWGGIQMDETAFPILLVDMAFRANAISTETLLHFWPMVRKAIRYLLLNGPVTGQDRWEEDAGYSPFTLAVEVAALLAAADMADAHAEPDLAKVLRDTADTWNFNIERWTYVTGTDLAKRLGVEGYYVRIAPPEVSDAASPAGGFVPIKNRPPDQSLESSTHVISPDALALVRFGLRAPDDPRILNTITVIDALLKVETPTGPAWHRYNDDGYGEHADGSPFDGTGTGRAWPLLTGERAHYELAAGRGEIARKLLRAMESFAGSGGLIPEQIWDVPDRPDRELFFGKPSGSAMPLVWAHAEYIKLRRSLRDGRLFDTPPQPVMRYIDQRIEPSLFIWQFNQKCTRMPARLDLRIHIGAQARVHWSPDNWKTAADITTKDIGIGVHIVTLPTASLPQGTRVQFTFYWLSEGRWEGTDYAVVIE
jgi:glucoamylase